VNDPGHRIGGGEERAASATATAAGHPGLDALLERLPAAAVAAWATRAPGEGLDRFRSRVVAWIEADLPPPPPKGSTRLDAAAALAGDPGADVALMEAEDFRLRWEMAQRLAGATAAIPEREGRVMAMHLAGLADAEFALALQLAPSTVRVTRLHAKRRLSGLLRTPDVGKPARERD
jgi:DNA-directed RNA polymerase specialized sigma24 family protein